MAQCEYYDFCGLDALESKEHCILHLDDPEKDVAAFNKVLDEHRKTKEGQFSYFVFPEDISFEGVVFNEEVVFFGATFHGKVDFHGSKFNKEADFNKVTFRGNMDFGDSEFIDNASFEDVTANDEAYFGGTIFYARSYIASSIFAGSVSFRGAEFKGDVIFKKTHFLSAVEFKRTEYMRLSVFMSMTFDSEVDFQFAIFSSGAFFNSVVFNGVTIFSNAISQKKTRFASCSFNCMTTYTETEFTDGVTFTETEFFNDVSFYSTYFKCATDISFITFHGRVDFSHSKYYGEANLSHITFNDEVSFYDTEFHEQTFISNSRFIGRVNLSHTYIYNVINFYGSVFHEEALFIDVEQNSEVCAKIDFRDTTFKKHTVFRAPFGSKINTRLFEGCSIDFRDVHFDSPDQVEFSNVDLRICQFMNTNLRGVNFTSIQWPKHKSRICLYDEVLMRAKEHEDGRVVESRYDQWDFIERTYRELKRNCEDQRNFGDMGDFHYGEKEARLRNPKTLWYVKLILYLYRTVAGYGERIAPPVFWTVGLFLVACLLYWAVPGCIIWGDDGKILWQNTGFGEPLYYSFKVMFFFRPPAPSHDVLRWVHLVQTVLSPLFLGFLALAIRQKMKR